MKEHDICPICHEPVPSHNVVDHYGKLEEPISESFSTAAELSGKVKNIDEWNTTLSPSVLDHYLDGLQKGA